MPDDSAYLGLPLPSPDAPSRRADVARIRQALELLDARAEVQAGHDDAVDDLLVQLEQAIAEQAGRPVALPDLSNVAAADFRAKAAEAGLGGATVTTIGPVTIASGGSVTVDAQAVLTVEQQIVDSTFGPEFSSETDYAQQDAANGTDWSEGKFALHSLTGDANSAAFGAPTLFLNDTLTQQAVVYHAAQDRWVVFYGILPAYAVVVKLQGGVPVYGTPVAIPTAGQAEYLCPVYVPPAQKIVLLYRDYGNNYYGTSFVCTVNDMTITFGPRETAWPNDTRLINGVYDSYSGHVHFVFSDYTANRYGKILPGAVSGTSMAWKNSGTFKAAEIQNPDVAYHVAAQRVVITYITSDNAWADTLVAGSYDGTNYTWGSPIGVGTTSQSLFTAKSLTYDASSQRVVGAYGNKLCIVNVTGLVVTKSLVDWGAGGSPIIAYDSNRQRVVMSYTHDAGGSVYRVAVRVIRIVDMTATIGSAVVLPDVSVAHKVTLAIDAQGHALCVYRLNQFPALGYSVAATTSTATYPINSPAWIATKPAISAVVTVPYSSVDHWEPTVTVPPGASLGWLVSFDAYATPLRRWDGAAWVPTAYAMAWNAGAGTLTTPATGAQLAAVANTTAEVTIGFTDLDLSSVASINLVALLATSDATVTPAVDRTLFAFDGYEQLSQATDFRVTHRKAFGVQPHIITRLKAGTARHLIRVM